MQADGDQNKTRNDRGNRCAMNAEVEAEDQDRVDHRGGRPRGKGDIHGALGVADRAQQSRHRHARPDQRQ